jgi:CO/xanthine dehydrogenase FAD-binding subunit
MLYNLREYHRPTDLGEALRLLRRQDVHTLPLAGGTAIVGQGGAQVEAVVDLSALGLDFLKREGRTVRLGAMVRLQAMVEGLGDVADGLLADTARRMAGWHIRNTATLGGMLAGGDIHSPLSVALAALDAQVAITGNDNLLPWPNLAPDALAGQLLTGAVVFLPEGEMAAAYEQVARTPADQPIVCAATILHRISGEQVAGRTVVGGLLIDALRIVDHEAITPGFDVNSIDITLHGDIAMSNYLGSAEYRSSVAPMLAQRTLQTALDGLGVQAGR